MEAGDLLMIFQRVALRVSFLVRMLNITDPSPAFRPELFFFSYLSWKDPNCVFRTHPKLQLKGVPTLMKWNTVSIDHYASMINFIKS